MSKNVDCNCTIRTNEQYKKHYHCNNQERHPGLFHVLYSLVRRIAAQESCEPDFLEKCITMGKALFDHPENIFPSNATDIERVCR